MCRSARAPIGAHALAGSLPNGIRACGAAVCVLRGQWQALDSSCAGEGSEACRSRAGVPRVHCHLLRHTFATNYLVRGIGNSLRLQQILGHTSLEMVRRYVAAANIQSSLIESRSSAMDLIAEPPSSRQSRYIQPKRSGRVPAARPYLERRDGSKNHRAGD